MIKAVFSILHSPYDFKSDPNLDVKLQSKEGSYDLIYDNGLEVYCGEVPEGIYKLFVNDIWIMKEPYYYLFGEIKSKYTAESQSCIYQSV